MLNLVRTYEEQLKWNAEYRKQRRAADPKYRDYLRSKNRDDWANAVARGYKRPLKGAATKPRKSKTAYASCRKAYQHIIKMKNYYPGLITSRESDSAELLQLWLDIVSERPCVYCGDVPQHIDHIVPLSRNGTHEWHNLQYICKTCNIAKNAQMEHEFLAWVDRLITIRQGRQQ